MSPRGSAAPPGLVVHYNEHDCVLATWQNVSFGVWRSKPTSEQLRALEAFSVEFIEDHPEGVSTVHVVHPDAQVPTPQVRDAMSDLTHRYAEHIACVGIVLLADGFIASAMRSLMMGLRLLASHRFDLVYATSVSELAASLQPKHAQKTGVILSTTELAAVLTALLRTLYAH